MVRRMAPSSCGVHRKQRVNAGTQVTFYVVPFYSLGAPAHGMALATFRVSISSSTKSVEIPSQHTHRCLVVLATLHLVGKII